MHMCYRHPCFTHFPPHALAWNRRVRRLRRNSSATCVAHGAPQRCSPCSAPLPPAEPAVPAMLSLQALPSSRSTAGRKW